MNITHTTDTTTITGLSDFSIAETLTCGQCFRHTRVTDNHYTIIAHGKRLHIEKEQDAIKLYPTDKQEYERIWAAYFDLHTDYASIKQTLAKDDAMKKVIAYAPGIRILNQDPLECLLTFILSQRKAIPAIKQMVVNLSELCGEIIPPRAEYGETDMAYTFPSLKSLTALTESDLIACKAGFRAKYIIDAILKIQQNEISFENPEQKTYAELKQMLLRIHGVGNKVSDCVILFSLKHREAFPVDVWVEKIMRHFYYADAPVSQEEIQTLARQKYGDMGGYAQQYLFYYAITNQIASARKKNHKI